MRGSKWAAWLIRLPVTDMSESEAAMMATGLIRTATGVSIPKFRAIIGVENSQAISEVAQSFRRLLQGRCPHFRELAAIPSVASELSLGGSPRIA